ncbi:MAG: cobalamin transport system substrate-binding protein [Acidobacteriota bacterium]|jgi:iron complex transport system substrate-binding protein|nr:cobalamin transport system substrate-binding protein [Acidobacteriota bacterium]
MTRQRTNEKRTDRRRVALVLSLFTALALAACSRGVIYEAGTRENATKQAAQRIISLSPSTTEVLWGVGAFPRVVAVSDYDDFPPEVKNLPKIGGWSNTNLEQVASLKPDLIVVTQSQSPMIKDKLDALGVPVVVVPSYTVEDALASITQIGAAVGEEDAAQKLLAETRAKLDAVRSATQNLKRPRVLCIVDRVPGTLRGLYAASEGSFLVQLIEIAGGDSIAPRAASGFGQIGKEAIVTLDPDIIIDMAQSAKDSKLAEDPKEVWSELARVKAVREGRVFALQDTSVLHPSQRVGDTARKFAELIHPEAFPK